MDLNPKARLILENQLVLLGTLRLLFGGLADRGMLDDNALQTGRLDSQIVKTRDVLEAVPAPHVPANARVEQCPNFEECRRGVRDCACASMGQ